MSRSSKKGPFVQERLMTRVEAMNASGARVIAIDVPSGLDADTGVAYAPTVHADLTVTLGLPKPGLTKEDGPRLCGDVWVTDIGVPFEAYAELGLRVPRDLFAGGKPALLRRFEELSVGDGIPEAEREPGRRVIAIPLAADLAIEEPRRFEHSQHDPLHSGIGILRRLEMLIDDRLKLVVAERPASVLSGRTLEEMLREDA